MECNKDEAIRAKEMAEKKMEDNDFEGARKIALKAQSLYPELDNISQLLTICDVHCSAQNRVFGSEKDWYGILQAEKFADELTVKKQYRRLALILHPDKNRFPGAEGAFKLICEANAALSDPPKKAVYDVRVRVSVKSASANPPTHYINRTSQLKRQYGAQNDVSNGSSSLNQHQASQSTSSSKQEVFWTCCPFCDVRYQYRREFVQKSLRCQTCSKPFIAYEISARGASLGSQIGQPGVQHMLPKTDSSQPAASSRKVVPDQRKRNMGIRHDKGSSASHTDSQGTTSRRSVQPKPGRQRGTGSEGIQEASAANISGDLNNKKADVRSARSSHVGKEGGTSNGATRETGDVEYKSKKGGRKRAVEPSEGFDTSNKSEVDVTATKKFGDQATDMKSESSHLHTRRSSRKRQNVSYNETDEDGLADLKKTQTNKENKEKPQGEALQSEDTKHGNQNSISNDADYSKLKGKDMGSVHSENLPDNYAACDAIKEDKEKVQRDALQSDDKKQNNQNPNDADYSKSKSKGVGTVLSEESLWDKDAARDTDCKARRETNGKSRTGADTVEIESDLDKGSFSADAATDSDMYHCPDPEFSDFDKVRDESRFDVNQFWACYDTLDGMPRFYAKVKKVRTSPFELSITWLEAVPIDEAFEKWVDEELPVGCGSFKFGQTEKTSLRLSFSHQVHLETGKKRGPLIIYPREGEVWALFKDWDMNWSSNPENHSEFKYEVVEVLSEFVAGSGIKVGYLDKVRGFESLFERVGQSEANSFLIQPNELYKFSHRVPCFKMTGSEREGVPVDSFELDPAALPLRPDDLYYPGKAKMECSNVDPASDCSPAKRKGKSMVSEGMSTPKSFVDAEGINEASTIWRSPRGLDGSQAKCKLV